MPKKLLALLLSIIALFAIADLARSARVQLAATFGSGDGATVTNIQDPSRTAHHTGAEHGASVAGIVPAAWDGSATR